MLSSARSFTSFCRLFQSFLILTTWSIFDINKYYFLHLIMAMTKLNTKERGTPNFRL